VNKVVGYKKANVMRLLST